MSGTVSSRLILKLESYVEVKISKKQRGNGFEMILKLDKEEDGNIRASDSKIREQKKLFVK